MELKNYQKKVINNLSLYLSKITETNIKDGWKNYWNELQVKEFSPYNDKIKNVPCVCMKVPTGGGKTFLASCSLKPIFNTLHLDTKMVVWLVSGDSIREQTTVALMNPNHPYRNRINVDFAGSVEVFTKEMMLKGQNFSPDTLLSQLSICIISYASLRIKEDKAEARKVFQENGFLKNFADDKRDNNNDLEGYPDTALINVLRNYNPVVIIDESHNAASKLSIEMITNLNPSFILELTATPKIDLPEKSNIISYVSANELKNENMVKLPVIVYKRNTPKDVFLDAIQLQYNLEQKAIEEEKTTGRYIRPIVLFQAETNIKDKKENRNTFDKIKQQLIDKYKIEKERIAIKISDKDELSGIDLFSRDCPIRFIITVNALKEGWDCSFAYILASLANKTSKTDVEQIIGRILRQPESRKCNDKLLNMSYVLTCSEDFNATVENVIKGLKNAGFSKKDYKATVAIDESQLQYQRSNVVQMNKSDNPLSEFDSINEIDVNNIYKSIQQGTENENFMKSIIEPALTQQETYELDLDLANEQGYDTSELGIKMNQITVNDKFKEEIKELKLPQFMLENEATIFSENDYELLEKEDLLQGFNLAKEDAKVPFHNVSNEMFEIDINIDSSNDEWTPKKMRLSSDKAEYFKNFLDSIKDKEDKKRVCVKEIASIINKDNHIGTEDIIKYVSRVIDNMDSDMLDSLSLMYTIYANKIQEYIKKCQDEYREKKFYEFASGVKLKCLPNYQFEKIINPIKTIDSIPYSLYSSELDDMNDTEKNLINSIIGTDNVKWWHRNIERKDFYINGAIKHYPDFIVETKRGTIVLVESKGDDRDNEDSRRKLSLGKKWESKAGVDKYKYFMVFDKKELGIDGACSKDDFLNIFKDL